MYCAAGRRLESLVVGRRCCSRLENGPPLTCKIYGGPPIATTTGYKKMASTGLNGPYPLTSGGVTVNVTKTAAGAYALGKTVDGTFHVYYVGRSDSDVAARLRQHVGKHQQFKFDYMSSPKAAFEKECRLYHDFSPPDNRSHPDRPNGSGWRCPVCSIFN